MLSTKTSNKLIHYGIYFAITAAIIGLDRWTKMLVEQILRLGDSIHLGSLFYITLVHNYGGAFGILRDQKIVFITVGVIVTASILIYIYVKKQLSWWMIIGLACISAGALGNMYDRVALGYVVDFIDVHIWSYVFNIADVAIDVGFGALIIDMFFVPHEHKAIETGEEIKKQD